MNEVLGDSGRGKVQRHEANDKESSKPEQDACKVGEWGKFNIRDYVGMSFLP